MALTRDEFQALLESGLSVRQISSMGDEAARAELSGYRKGAEMMGSAQSRVAPTMEQGVGQAEPISPFEYLTDYQPAYPMVGPPGPVSFGQLVEGGLNALSIGGTVAGVAGLTKAGLKKLGAKLASSRKGQAGTALVLGRDRARAAKDLLAPDVPTPVTPGVPRPQIPPDATMVPSPGGFSPGGFSAPTVAGQAPAVGSAASRVGAEGAEELAKDFSGYAMRRGFAVLKQAGMKDDAASIGKVLGREIKSRTELSPADWQVVIKSAEKKIADAAVKAAKKAATTEVRAAAKAEVTKAAPKSKVAGSIKPRPKAKPKVGSAESRTGPPQPVSLEEQLRNAVKVEQHMNKLGFTEAEKQLVRQQIMNQ